LTDAGDNSKLVRDVRILLDEIGRRHEQSMDEFYPKNARGERPWGYLWAQTMPCDECRHRFPVIGSAILRYPALVADDPGACFSLIADRSTGELEVVIHDGIDAASPTLLSPSRKRGKVARCPFCDHPHVLDVIKAKAKAGLLCDKILLIADLDSTIGPVFRLPSPPDIDAVRRAEDALQAEKPFSNDVSAVPSEIIPAGNNDTVRASLYGVQTYGGMCCARQTLSFVRLCRIVSNLRSELLAAGYSNEYTRALLGYASAVIVRKLRYSTRGATLRPSTKQVDHIFKNQASLNYGFDFFETGIDNGPGTWRSLILNTLIVIEKLTRGAQPSPAHIRQGSALHLPFRPKSVTAVVTDPPYYNMIDYSDATDLFFVWLKRALGGAFPELFDVAGLQEKEEEIIVKRGGVAGEHRTSEFYTQSLKASFVNARSVLYDDGAMTLVFGHGDPKAWRLLLSALIEAGFVVTGSWPARTEEGAGAGAANIVVTITIACRPAPSDRPDGLQAMVDLEVEREIHNRVSTWERDGLALTDQLMAAYGPAMEVLERYEHVLRPDGTLVEIDRYLSLARRTVQDAAAIKVDGLPLETFDARTRFALFWARLYGRQLAPKSEAVFQAMASNQRLEDVRRDILEENTKGYRLADFGEFSTEADYENLSAASPTVDVVRQMVRNRRAIGSTRSILHRKRYSGEFSQLSMFLETQEDNNTTNVE
jgi:putative DNA methylase